MLSHPGVHNVLNLRLLEGQPLDIVLQRVQGVAHTRDV